jgi:hypothetical protein
MEEAILEIIIARNFITFLLIHASTVIRPTTLRKVFKRKTEIKNNRKVVV